MDKQYQKKWYEKNKAFLRAFERTLIFQRYRNQRIRVQKLQKELNHEKSILGKYRTEMEKERTLFLLNFEESQRKKEGIPTEN